MAIEIVPYLSIHEAAVRRFNERLLEGGADPEMQFPETPDPGWMPHMELRVAVEGEEVRGGYILRRQRIATGGELRAAAHYRLPLSEGLVNRAYAALALRLVRDALAREPRLYALGMGGWDKPLPQMLKRMGWRIAATPFYFKVPHPFRFLRQIRALRSSFLRRLASNAAAFSGAGWFALWLAGVARSTEAPEKADMPPAFAGWADGVWEASCAGYGMLAARDAATLGRPLSAFRSTFPAGADGRRMGRAAGYAHARPQAIRRPAGGHACGLPGGGGGCGRGGGGGCADARRTRRRFDYFQPTTPVLGRAHWKTRASGGVRRISLLALSPALAAEMEGRPEDEIHMNRGDGDGPIHL